MRTSVWFAAIGVVLVTSCASENASQVADRGGTKMEIKVESAAFENEGRIPAKYTCDGANVSPPLSWTEVPSGAVSLALIADDPDAPSGTWVHWVMFNIPPNVKELAEDVPKHKTLANGAMQGTNSGGAIGYAGPAPPSGTHRYYFKLYALDSTLALEPGVKKPDVVDAMKGHILAQGQIMGRYSRQ